MLRRRLPLRFFQLNSKMPHIHIHTSQAGKRHGHTFRSASSEASTSSSCSSATAAGKTRAYEKLTTKQKPGGLMFNWKSECEIASPYKPPVHPSPAKNHLQPHNRPYSSILTRNGKNELPRANKSRKATWWYETTRRRATHGKPSKQHTSHTRRLHNYAKNNTMPSLTYPTRRYAQATP